MKYEIWGGTLPAVTVTLNSGEAICTQSGGMSWMTQGFQMDTNMKGGFGKAFGRMFSGESMFLATYTATCDDSKITFASSVPGEIRALEIGAGKEYIAQKGAFLCAEPSVEIKAHVTKGVKGGLFGGEGFVLQRYTGHGTVFMELDGSVREYTLAAGEKMTIDTGNVAAFESTVTYDAQMVKGVKNVLFGGEGLFLTTLTGPGKIWLQTMSIAELAARIVPYVPSKS